MWKVIVADDEAYIRQALQNMISWERLGCTLLSVASDGEQLREQIEAGRPDIVITDIRMPLMDGIEVCRYIAENCPDTQVIILSAYSEFEYARAAIRYNVCEYVLKVAVLEELPLAVEKAVRCLEQQREEQRGEALPEGQDLLSDSLYEKTVRYIEQNYADRLTLDKIAEQMHASKSYLSRLYKSRSGRNLFDDILSRQIEKAKEYLITTDWKIYRISEKVGFEDAGYFSRVFKKQCGLSPKEFKRKYADHQHGDGER